MEIIDIVKEDGTPTGVTVDRNQAHEEGLLHRTAHVWILRKRDGIWEALLQKRSLTKESFPGQFDTSSAGHIQAGDEPLESALRELEEELGIKAAPEDLTPAGTFRIQYAAQFHGRLFHDNELAFLYLYQKPVNEAALVLQAEEVESVTWFPLREIAEARARNDQRFCVPRDGLISVRKAVGDTDQDCIIDRNHVIEAFRAYTAPYCSYSGKVDLKIIHTYKVAENCDRIAESLGLTGLDREIAWLLGMLHDIGRFEQIRRFDTFADSLSIPHAVFGAELLFGPDQLIRRFVPELVDHPDRSIVELAIRVHSDFRIPAGLSERERMFCHIIRDADKVDIFRANLDHPLEVIYNCSAEELLRHPVTEAVMDSVRRHTCVQRSLKRRSIDHIVGHICLVFELVYPMSYRLTEEQGYLNRLLKEIEPTDPHAREQFAEIRSIVNEYIKPYQ